jgi:hypothetical protein
MVDEAVLPLALLQGPVEDGQQPPEEVVPLRLGLGSGALHHTSPGTSRPKFKE